MKDISSRRNFLGKLGLFSIFAPAAIDHYVWRAERKVVEARWMPNPDYITADYEVVIGINPNAQGIIPIIYRRAVGERLEGQDPWPLRFNSYGQVVSPIIEYKLT